MAKKPGLAALAQAAERMNTPVVAPAPSDKKLIPPKPRDRVDTRLKTMSFRMPPETWKRIEQLRLDLELSSKHDLLYVMLILAERNQGYIRELLDSIEDQ